MKKIIVKNDEEAEVNIFLNFLHSKEYPQHRNMIFSNFPELKTLIDTGKEDERTIVKNFIELTRGNNKDNLEKATDYIENEVKSKGEQTLQILANLMDYAWELGSPDYILIPTIFPMSPFKGNTFFFSIYKSLHGDTEFSKVLAVSAHEISHMFLFDILKKKNVSLDSYVLYFIKELIAPILVYQDDFEEVFKKEIVGNYNVLEIYFEVGDRKIRAFDYFLEKFEKNKVKKEKFKDFLDDMIYLCSKINTQIKGKRLFDNKHGLQILQDPKILAQFREPIKID